MAEWGESWLPPPQLAFEFGLKPMTRRIEIASDAKTNAGLMDDSGCFGGAWPGARDDYGPGLRAVWPRARPARREKSASWTRARTKNRWTQAGRVVSFTRGRWTQAGELRSCLETRRPARNFHAASIPLDSAAGPQTPGRCIRTASAAGQHAAGLIKFDRLLRRPAAGARLGAGDAQFGFASARARSTLPASVDIAAAPQRSTS